MFMEYYVMLESIYNIEYSLNQGKHSFFLKYLPIIFMPWEYFSIACWDTHHIIMF